MTTDTLTERSASIGLRYVARAGLLPELSRQTYDSFFKAIREAVLNGLDAGAQHVRIDFSQTYNGTVTIEDDGSGMSLDDLTSSFFSLGGSSKYGDQDKFGRIGIGSLALLHYADRAEIVTKKSGDGFQTRADVSHRWDLDLGERQSTLEDLEAGRAHTEPYSGDRSDHFTSVRLLGIAPKVAEELADISRFYDLIDQLRRSLPLRWPDSRLREAIERSAPEAWAAMAAQIDRYSGRISVESQWGSFDLERRVFGDDSSASENWNGQPRGVLTTLPVMDEDGTTREIVLAGYLLSQAKATPAWSGLTARVQNVAVEERTFFDVENDPGFRKYITGDVQLMGGLDRARLVNIDRASFNRECVDYQVSRRYMANAITTFKSASVQRPQRQKTVAKRILDRHLKHVETAERVLAAADEFCAENGITTIRASFANPPRSDFDSRTILDELAASNIIGIVDDEVEKFQLGVNEDGEVVARVGTKLSSPTVSLCGKQFDLTMATGSPDDKPVFIRKRPFEIVFNTSSRSVDAMAESLAMALVLEIASVIEVRGDDDLYGTILSLLGC